MFTLVLDYQPHVRPERNADFKLCLEKNCHNRHIAAIHILTTHQKIDVKHRKITLIKVANDRSTYRDFFTYVNASLPRKSVILANRDIWFDDTLVFAHLFDLNTHVLALSRDDCHLGCPPRARCIEHKVSYREPGEGSQDAWVFNAPLTEASGMYADFLLGLTGCDNRIAYEFDRVGYTVKNPSISICLHHVHTGGIRLPRIKVSEPWLMVRREAIKD